MEKSLEIKENGLFEIAREKINAVLDCLENEQSKINKAYFETLSMEQRDKFCCSLQEQGVNPKRIEKITGKSQPTINRHLNKKNS